MLISCRLTGLVVLTVYVKKFDTKLFRQALAITVSKVHKFFKTVLFFHDVSSCNGGRREGGGGVGEFPQ